MLRPSQRLVRIPAEQRNMVSTESRGSQADRTRASIAWEWLLAALVGSGLLLLSNLVVPPADAPFPGHGVRFAAMAQDPFAFAGEFPQRILWPVLAWLFAQVGVGTVAFSGVCNGALLAVVFWFARRRTGSLVSALLVACAIAASGVVLVYKPMMCFSDTLNLLLLVFLIHFADRAKVFWPLVVLTAFSHELVFFFTPWLIYLRVRNGGRLWPEVGLWGISVGIYGTFRIVLKLLELTGPYDAAYYFNHAIWVPWGLPAIWMLWGFVVLVEFGPLLIGMFFAGRRGELAKPSGMGGRWWPWLYFPSLLALMLLAYDVMRFAPLVFPPVLLGLVALVISTRGRGILAAILVVQVASYVWLHPIASEQGGRHFTEVSQLVFTKLELLGSRTPGDAWTFTSVLLEHYWHYALAALLALVAIVLVGRLLAGSRYDSGEPSEHH
ncbi:MAG: hypothetical protein ACI91B_002151 [Planctomycetota bacterium]|jgi:hypothetical protein